MSKKVKSKFDKISNIVFFILLIFLIIQNTPILISNFKKQGKTIDPIQLLDLSGEEVVIDKSNNTPAVLVFWSIDCPPCKVEMARYDSAIKNNPKLKAKIFAVNLYDNNIKIKKYMKKRNWSFKVYHSPNNEIAKRLNIISTPSVLHLGQSMTIDWLSSGISPTAIFRAQRL